MGGVLNCMVPNLRCEFPVPEADKPLHRLWATLRSYLGLGREALAGPIGTPESLARFLDERSSFIAQTSLYGYLQTRAGMRYPELVDDDSFVASINVAKWHLWLDCLSDLAVYAGSRVAHHTPDETPRIARMMVEVLDEVLAGAGTPVEAGTEFATHAAQSAATCRGHRLAHRGTRRVCVHGEPGGSGALGARQGRTEGARRGNRAQLGAVSLAGGSARFRSVPRSSGPARLDAELNS